MKTRIIKLEVIELDDDVAEDEQPKETIIYKDEEELDPSKYFDHDKGIRMVKRAAVELNITGPWEE